MAFCDLARRNSFRRVSTDLTSQASLVGEPLAKNKLRWNCDPNQFDFKTTADLEDLKGTLLGQERAESAIDFGVSM